MELQPTASAMRPKAFMKRFGIGETKFYDELKSGRLVAKKAGGVLLVTEAAAQAWLNSLPDYRPQVAA
jgi:hypothetical protein